MKGVSTTGVTRPEGTLPAPHATSHSGNGICLPRGARTRAVRGNMAGNRDNLRTPDALLCFEVDRLVHHPLDAWPVGRRGRLTCCPPSLPEAGAPARQQCCSQGRGNRPRKRISWSLCSAQVRVRGWLLGCVWIGKSIGQTVDNPTLPARPMTLFISQ